VEGLAAGGAGAGEEAAEELAPEDGPPGLELRITRGVLLVILWLGRGDLGGWGLAWSTKG
jgi:hypothetical protein